MRAIMILAFVLIGMIGHAQEVVKVDSIQIGDEIIFDKKCTDMPDIYDTWWDIPKGASFVVTHVAKTETTLLYIEVIDFSGEVMALNGDMLIYNQDKKRLHVCR